MEQVINDGNWLLGVDSISYQLQQGQYQWAQNVTNRGGLVGTRQGFAQITALKGESEIPRGICLFTPIQGSEHPAIVVAIGSYVHSIPWPYTTPLGVATRISNILFPTTTRQVNFEIAVQAQKNIDGSISSITPRFVLMMQDGVTAPAYYYYNSDTSTFSSGHTVPTNDNTDNPPWNTPTGTYMKWVGDRLWVATGNKLHAGDLLNPLQFEEQKVEASGGFFYIPGSVTGMGVTHDFKSLLVMSDQTTSAFQVGIEDRTLWSNTQDFQRVLFPGIGCASNRTIVNQYGMTWWMSHDGVVALDSSLQTYQTSRIQVRDHNMSRSKEGISWERGGGAAGTFGNWLFFSVPSNSRYNNHTWVLDQAVQSDLNSLTPPAWVSNWTGIRPEQWVTGAVSGIQRCFFLSYDLVPSGHQATVWEAFIGQRMDVPRLITTPYTRQSKDIACALEAKFTSLAPNQYMQFLYAELDLAEIIGTVKLQVYYCGRRTSYKKILDKQITATVSPDTEQVFDPDDLIDVFVPQYRTVRSVQDSHDATDANTGIQTPYLRMIDREFSLLVTWTGQMSVAGIRTCVTPRTDYDVGRCEEDELTTRSITAEGTGSITNDPVPNNLHTGEFTSKYLAPLRARWVEFPAYDSAVPNGVFFVDIPTYSPVAGGYSLDQYTPYKVVSISTETAGDTIVYTADGTIPTLSPLNGIIYTTPLHITAAYLPLTLKARGFRDGLLPSATASGVFSQATCATPVFTPSEGQYPGTDYPMSISIRSTTVGATIRYTTNNSPVTVTSPVYSAPVNIATGQWLRAKAFKVNYLNSTEKAGRYTSEPTCAKPTFTPDGGSYDVGDYPKSITLASTTVGATIQYTINDETISNGNVIDNGDQVVLNINDTLRARAQKPGLADSLVKQATYTAVMQTCNEPTLEPDGGEFVNNTVIVTFRCTTPNATICYTIANLTIPPDPTRGQALNRVHDGDQITISLGHKFIKALAFTDDTLDSIIHLSEYELFHP